VTNGHWSLGANSSFDTTTKRSGARSLRINPTAAVGTANTVLSLIDTQLLVARVYVRFASLPTEDLSIVVNQQASSREGVWFKQSDSKLYCGSSVGFGATGVTVTTGVWYRVDVKWDLDQNPRLVDAQVDGVALGQYSRAAAASNSSRITFGDDGNARTVDMYFDDLLTSVTLADYPLGAGKVEHFVGASDGTHNIAGTGDFQFGLTGTNMLNSTTNAYTQVSKVPLSQDTNFINMLAPPNATDYVEVVLGPASGISTPTAAPRGVEVIAGIRQSGTGAGNMAVKLNDNGTTNDVYTATGVAGVTSTSYKRKHYATAPTGGAWTVVSGAGNFNNLKVRFGSPAALDVNPDQYFDSLMVEAEFAEVAAGLTLTAESGSYALTGQNVSLKVSKRLVCAPGTYAITGLDASLKVAKRLQAESGSYALTGQDVTFTRGKTLVAEAGTYAITGLDVAMKRSLRLVAEQGSYALTGQPASLLKQYKLTAETGSYALTGAELAFRRALRLIAEVGAYNLTGLAAGVLKQYYMQMGLVDVGIGDMEIGSTFEVGGSAQLPSYTLTGQDVTITFQEGALTLVAEQGTYVLTGLDVAMRVNRVLNAAQGAYVLTGNDASIKVAKRLIAEMGSYNLTGLSMTPLVSKRLVADVGSYQLTGLDVTLQKTGVYSLVMEAGSYVLTGLDMDMVITRVSSPSSPAPYPTVKEEAGSSRTKSKSALQLQIEREDEELLSFIHVILNSEIQSTLWEQ
jgi:hypothetical protein